MDRTCQGVHGGTAYSGMQYAPQGTGEREGGGALFSYELAYALGAGKERDLRGKVGSDPIRVSRSRGTNTFTTIDPQTHAARSVRTSISIPQLRAVKRTEMK